MAQPMPVTRWVPTCRMNVLVVTPTRSLSHFTGIASAVRLPLIHMLRLLHPPARRAWALHSVKNRAPESKLHLRARARSQRVTVEHLPEFRNGSIPVLLPCLLNA